MARNPEKNPDSAEIQFRLANAWQLKGRLELAIEGYRRILALDPEHIKTYLYLGNVMLLQGKTDEAIEIFKRAVEKDPHNEDLRFRYAFVRDLVSRKSALRPDNSTEENHTVIGPGNPDGKLNLNDQKRFQCHRSGWDFALKALEPLHNPDGILFDGFIENNFAWKHWKNDVSPPHILNKLRLEGTYEHLATSAEKGITPYREPWVGFVHNPPNMPKWFHYQESPQTIFSKPIWRESLEHCIGLFCMSDYLADWIRRRTGKPVSRLIHPTEIPELQFDFDKFKDNGKKKIIQIGWWLRKLGAIYRLPIPRGNRLGYEKIRLVPRFFDDADNYLKKLILKETEIHHLERNEAYYSNTRDVQHLPNDEYDQMLSQNIVFLDLYDTSANVAIVECIARTTPILVNPLPAVVEYLGEDYPFYFNSHEEAAEKVLDPGLIQKTHHYLKHCDTRKKLDQTYFRQSMQESEVYRLI